MSSFQKPSSCLIHRDTINCHSSNRGLSLVYFKDADIDPPIRLLVKLLNSHLTVTAYSCGGHWKPKPISPYVSFFILDGKQRAWERIWKRCRKDLAPFVSDVATLNVTETYELPDCRRDWVMWHFIPTKGTLRDIFKTERDFRKTYDPLISKTCWALRRAMREGRG